MMRFVPSGTGGSGARFDRGCEALQGRKLGQLGRSRRKVRVVCADAGQMV
jgi:hypothetical protein